MGWSEWTDVRVNGLSEDNKLKAAAQKPGVKHWVAELPLPGSGQALLGPWLGGLMQRISIDQRNMN
jgi:hypothetical protein